MTCYARSTAETLLEFFVIGVVFGVTEDVLAVVVATDAEVTLEVIAVVVLIAIPFAILSELVVDHPRFIHFERLAIRLKRTVPGSSSDGYHLIPRIHWDGRRDHVMSPKHHHHRCNLCGSDFDTGKPDEALYVTGPNIPVDGGWTAHQYEVEFQHKVNL